MPDTLPSNHEPLYSIGGLATNNLRFPGQYFLIEDGLHYNWYRDYDPSIGRYIQPDPLRDVVMTASATAGSGGDASTLLQRGLIRGEPPEWTPGPDHDEETWRSFGR